MAERQKLGHINRIVIKVGALTDIVPDALLFGFEAASMDTDLEGTRLEINTIPVAGRCRSCGKTFEVEEHIFLCESFNIDMTRGDELDIEYIEADD